MIKNGYKKGHLLGKAMRTRYIIRHNTGKINKSRILTTGFELKISTAVSCLICDGSTFYSFGS